MPLLLHILPYFIAFSVVVAYVFKLTTTKWRFISLPDALNIVRVATVLTLALVVLDYLIVAPAVGGTFFLGRITIVLYWFLEILFLAAPRFAYRYFRYTRVRRHARTEGASPALLIGRAADAEVLLRGIESGAVKQLWPVGCCRRRHPTAARPSATFPCSAASTDASRLSPSSQALWERACRRPSRWYWDSPTCSRMASAWR